MGMASSDDDWALIEADIEQKWAEEMPHKPWGYDHTPTEDEVAFHKDAVKKHLRKRPKGKTGYENEKR